jgi:tetratricopeptide (TPR) repeat protein
MGACRHFRCAKRTTFALCVSVALAASYAVPVILAEVASASSQPAEPPQKLRPTVCLHTEFNEGMDENSRRFRLMRELGRQAVLIAARDELGLATRDETLGEVFADSIVAAKQDLFIAVRPQYTGDMQLQIWLASKPEDLLPTKREKVHDSRVIVKLTENLEPRIRAELRDKLRTLGFDGKATATNEKNVPPDSIAGQLLEMNFVSQFAAVRAAHAAIAREGSSRGWLGVLARGYANLALATEHHWKSDTEVFAARALLYAERSVAAHPDDSLAHADRAYVQAIVGLHSSALDELKLVADLRNKHPEQPQLPNWVELIEPYCAFERVALSKFADQRPSLRQLTQRLVFEQLRAFGDERWIFDAAKGTMSACPEEYGVYAALTSGNASLTVGRTGAYYAPAALAHFLPARIAKLEGIPKAVRDAAVGEPAENEEEKAKDEKESKKKQEQDVDAAASSGEYAAATLPIVDSLRIASRGDSDRGEPSWSALGEVIFEEQFVQAANFLNISLNATESSFGEAVKSMRRATAGHRYQPYLESFATHTIPGMPIVDARGNMKPMVNSVWRADSAAGIKRGADAAWFAIYDRSLTFNGMLEAYSAMGRQWWGHFDSETRQRWADEFKSISPHSPQSLRFAIALVEKPTYEQAIQWESEAGEDPVVYRTLGEIFATLKQYDDAVRVYERSITLSPHKNSYIGLANAHRSAGRGELWLPTLERFFEVESLGLEHAQVHALIANELIEKDKLAEAEPHAAAAGETGSNWGLLLASQVSERLGHWDESEKAIRSAAEYYPSSSGPEWYFWCRRTGRGNLDDARKLAQQYFAKPWAKTDINGPLRLFTFHIAENDAKTAYADIKDIVKRATDIQTADEDMTRAHVQIAIVARELKEAEAAQADVKEARRLIEQFRPKFPHLASIYTTICDVLDDKPPTDEALAAIDKEIESEPSPVRVNAEYFLGRAFDLAGDQARAEKYWKDCVARGPYERYPATLAGKYLCDRHKTSRP